MIHIILIVFALMGKLMAIQTASSSRKFFDAPSSTFITNSEIICSHAVDFRESG